MTSDSRLRANRARTFGWDRAVKSGLEESVREALRRRGVSFSYEGMVIRYLSPRRYIPDFSVAGKMVIEVKGYFDPEDRRKLKEVREQCPELDLRMVFENAYAFLRKADRQKFSAWLLEEKGRKRGSRELVDEWKASCKRAGAMVTYADWAERHGIPWAERTVPDEWIEDALEYLREAS